MTSDEIGPHALFERVESGEPFTLLDLRNRDEFEEWHVSGAAVDARQVPITTFVQAEVRGTVGDVLDDPIEPVVVVCARGDSSDHVAALLRAVGVDAVNLADGMEGWARVYVAEEVGAVPDETTVIQYRRPSSGCLAYLVVSGGEAMVIDPLRAFAERYVADAAAMGVDLTYAADTHVHADHVSGVRAVADLSGAESVYPAGASERGLAFEATLVEGGDTLRLGSHEVEVVPLPGHTTEAVGYRVGDLLVAGDTLFLENVARPDLEEGDEGAPSAARRLHATIHDRLLGTDLVVAPAHYSEAATPAPDGSYTARVADLEERLAALSMDREDFVDYATRRVPPRPANYETIIETNLGRHDAADEEAFELELGPNNCAATSVDAD